MNLGLSLPEFSTIQPNKVKTELEKRLTLNRQVIELVLKQTEFTWDNFAQPLEDIQLELNNFWVVISHLHAVASIDELRAAYETCLPLITAYTTEMGGNKQLYQAYKSIKNSIVFQNLSIAQKQVINHKIRDFELAGVALSGQAKKAYEKIQLKLSKLSNQFQQNVMDASDGWSKLIKDETLLTGVADHVKQALKQNAKKKQLEGWLLSLDFSTFYAVVAYADNRLLREEIYIAYFTRASDQGSHNPQHDNSNIMFDILKYRDKKAKLLGFKHFGEYSLATKMANSTKEIRHFLTDLAEKIKPLAVNDWNTLVDFAETKLQLKDLKAWDVAYASEKLREHQYGLSQEELRPYFEINQVINGLFQITKKLYGIEIVERKEAFDKWHDDVRFYELYTQEKKLLAGFYLDLYARPKKRGGAWMDSCRTRHGNVLGTVSNC